MTELHCWMCGVEPDDTVELATAESDRPVAVIPTAWPPADHQHSATPPTPQQLVDDGHATFRRIMEDAS